MKRVLLIVGGIIALLLIIGGLYFVFFGQSGGQGEYAFFPEAGDRDVPDWLTSTQTAEQQYVPPPNYNSTEAPSTNPQTAQPTVGRTPILSLDFLSELYARYRGTSYTGNSSGGTGGTAGSGTGVPYTGSQTGTGITYTGNGPVDQSTPWEGGGSDSGGRNNDRNEIEFDPATGDLWVAGVHFNFTGFQTVANNTTSDVVGDPDNMALGTSLGVLIGSLVGDPGMGLLLGTALGSNLYNGFTLQDFGIGLDNGVPSFGGESILDGGSAFGGGEGDGSIEGMGEGECTPGEGETDFGGKVFAIPCTCPDSTDKFAFTIEDGEYAGTYLVNSETTKCGTKKTKGSFSVLGSYEEGTGSGECEMYAVEDCIEYPTEAGTIKMYGSD